jgi:hypothetical protein
MFKQYVDELRFHRVDAASLTNHKGHYVNDASHVKIVADSRIGESNKSPNLCCFLKICITK